MRSHAPCQNSEEPPSIAVAVLAGGRSRRFGADKALFQLCPDGRTLLERAVETGREVASEVFVVGHARYSTIIPHTAIVPDDLPGEGPLAAIQSALSFASASRVLVLACDMPCVSITLLEWMASIETDAGVVLPRSSDGRWQPIPAIYSQSILPAIEATLLSGDRAVTAVLNDVAVHAISETELRSFDPELSSLFSLNCPSQIEQAKACASCN